MQELEQEFKSNTFIIIFEYNIIFEEKNQNMFIGFNFIQLQFSKSVICLIFSPKSLIKRYEIIIIVST